MPYAPADIRSLARQWTGTAIQTLASIAGDPAEDAGPRVSAAIALLDRGWGKPAQTHTGADGEGAITFEVRHIIETRSRNVSVKAIEHQEVEGKEKVRET